MFLQLFANFERARVVDCVISNLQTYRAMLSGPSLVSRAGDAGSTERKEKVPNEKANRQS